MTTTRKLLTATLIAAAGVTWTAPAHANEREPFEPVDLRNHCPSGWFPESYDAARADDPNRCVPFDPCIWDTDTGNGSTLWHIADCNPFLDPNEPGPILTFNGDDWVPAADQTTPPAEDVFVAGRNSVTPGLPADLDVFTVGPLVEPAIATIVIS